MTDQPESCRPAGGGGTEALGPAQKEALDRLDRRFRNHETDRLMMFIKDAARKNILARLRGPR